MIREGIKGDRREDSAEALGDVEGAKSGAANQDGLVGGSPASNDLTADRQAAQNPGVEEQAPAGSTAANTTPLETMTTGPDGEVAGVAAPVEALPGETTAEVTPEVPEAPGVEETADVQGERETTAKLTVQELAAGWKDKEQQKPALATTIRFGAKTNLGRIRENNEDKFDFFIPEQDHILAARGCLYAVADGMGGHAAGQIASEYALNVSIRAYYWDTHSELEQALRSAIEQANELINQAANALPERNQMGTTLTCAVIREDDLYVGHVGDSRAYLFREGELRQITEDHSWVAEQVKRGAMTPEEAECSPFRNYITRSLGTMPDVDVDIYHEKMQEDDIILLCSDGLCGMISDADIAETLAGRAPSLATLMLVERANEAGGRDNITAVVLQIASIEAFEKKKGFRWPRAARTTKK